MQNQCFNRNMFGDLPTQRMAQKVLPILIKHAQKGHTILLRDLAEKIAPHLTKVNWTMKWVLAWIQTTLCELERQDNWEYGKIPVITTIVLAAPEMPTNWAEREIRPRSWEDYRTHHLLPVFDYPNWERVKETLAERM